MNEIQPGEGWRLLRLNEVVKERDEYWSALSKIWVQHDGYGGHKACEFHAVRRRIPAKPEAMEIDGRTFKCNSFDEVITRDDIGDRRKLVSSPEQARQLADWLNRYAEWREAQEATENSSN
jgi:hypothetical protein